jgi:hypothetical protein
MANCKKLLDKARNSPQNLRFEEVCKLAECFGWTRQKQGGTSHAVFIHPSLGNTAGSLMNFQSKSGKAKAYQVRQLLDAIDGLNHG